MQPNIIQANSTNVKFNPNWVSFLNRTLSTAANFRNRYAEVTAMLLKVCLARVTLQRIKL